MAKRGGRKISKKKYVGLIRHKNNEGERVWKYREKNSLLYEKWQECFLMGSLYVSFKMALTNH